LTKSIAISYEVWKKMGSPQTPTSEQIAILEKAGKLEMLSSPTQIKIDNGVATIAMNLPRQGVPLLVINF
jgi:xylan 1,4-beta-xylosidase